MKLLTLLYYSFRSLLLRGPINSFKLFRAEKEGDMWYGISTQGMVMQSGSGAHHYQGAGYYVLDKIFSELNAIKLPAAFFDIGCGMGRVLVVAADRGFSACQGIDINEALVNAAKENVQSAKIGNKNIELRAADATSYDYPADAQLYFLFNPFNAVVLEKCLQKIAHDSSAQNFFLYMNPLHSNVFERLGFKKVLTIKTNFYTEAILYSAF